MCLEGAHLCFIYPPMLSDFCRSFCFSFCHLLHCQPSGVCRLSVYSDGLTFHKLTGIPAHITPFMLYKPCRQSVICYHLLLCLFLWSSRVVSVSDYDLVMTWASCLATFLLFVSIRSDDWLFSSFLDTL